jgi:hypothetical protein
MKTYSMWSLRGAAFVFLVVAAAHAQYQLVVLERVITSRSLSGYVDIGSTNVVGNGVTVELCSPDWKKVLASAITDDKGIFHSERCTEKCSTCASLLQA